MSAICLSSDASNFSNFTPTTMPGGFSSFFSSISSFRPSTLVSAPKPASAPRPGVAPAFVPGSNGVYTSNAATDALPPAILRFGAGVWAYMLPIFGAVGSIALVVVYVASVLGLFIAAIAAAGVTVHGLIAMTVTLRYLTGSSPPKPPGKRLVTLTRRAGNKTLLAKPVARAFVTTHVIMSLAGAGGVLYALYHAIDQGSYLTLLLISTQAIIATCLAVALISTMLTTLVVMLARLRRCIRNWQAGEGVTDISKRTPGEAAPGKGLKAAIREAWKQADEVVGHVGKSGAERPPVYTALMAANSASTSSHEAYTSNAATDALPPVIFSLLAGVWTYLLPVFTALGTITSILLWILTVFALFGAAYLAAAGTLHYVLAVTVMSYRVRGRRFPKESLEHYEVPGFLMFFGGICGVLYALWQAVEAPSYGQLVVIASKAFLTISLVVALPWTAIMAALAAGSLVSRCAGYRPVGQSERVSQKGRREGCGEEQWKGMGAIFESERKPMVSSEAAQPVLGHHSVPLPGDPGWGV
nr:hypothetical protein B0A51_04183 [Rachicladosporium sp. CCFEE 5018]